MIINEIKRLLDFVMDILETITFVGSLFIVVYLFIMSPHQIRGASMENTFFNGEYILTSRIAYKFDRPKRGDIVVFKSPKNPDIDYIKRIIAAPGDRIRISNGQVYVNDEAQTEGYTATPTNLFQNGFLEENMEVIVPPEHLFVMGDNRMRSSDSREFGFIPTDDIIGKVFFRYFPINKAGSVKNPLVN